MLDTTIKSATEPIGRLLAPTWSMVASLKKHQAMTADPSAPVKLEDWFSPYPAISWAEYTESYLNLLRLRYGESPLPFLALLQRPHVILG